MAYVTHTIKRFSIMALASAALLFTASAGSAFDSTFVGIPNHGQEALTWCGPATGQMIMGGYPSTPCNKLQEDVAAEIQANKTETMWDTDPNGLKSALHNMCGANWVVFSNTDPQQIMYNTAHYLKANKYPVAVLKDTASTPSYPQHAEHWVAVKGIVTDVDPVANTSVTLKYVQFNDPAVPLGQTAMERFVDGNIWYSEFKPVSKTGSSYNGQYVAVIEPPLLNGFALKDIKWTRKTIGPVITAQEALAAARGWINSYNIGAVSSYKDIARAVAGTPLLVNKDKDGYYLIPYTVNGRMTMSVIINAYSGEFEEIGAFNRAIVEIPKRDVIVKARKLLRASTIPENQIKTELVHVEESEVNRYFPVWRVRTGQKYVDIRYVDEQ